MSAESSDGKIKCEIDGALCHSIQLHLKKNHPEWTVEKYQTAYPAAPLLSDRANAAIAEQRKKSTPPSGADPMKGRQPMHKVFGLPERLTQNARGEFIMISVNEDSDLGPETLPYVPDIDLNYVFDADLMKWIIIGYELNKPIYLHGLHGTGKTTCLEQAAARTRRPFFRLQHTINTEESHVLGQWTVKSGETVFSLGPLPLAMIHGMIYCADEYDFALPAVTGVYQPVLEGKPLVIKEAPPEMRVIRPHKDFRFVATGNTNGGGDDTGLYQGTQIQNAANYSRFPITVEVGYPAANVEAAIVSGQSGCRMEDARKLVSFADEVRKNFIGGQISSTVSPRELINAAYLAVIRGGAWRDGVKAAFAARLSRTDREVVEAFAQRIWG